jgi:isopentenyl diphosphate isomerase/L-lactate dehydrogenase-like FMN-dependent dehydrogenase
MPRLYASSPARSEESIVSQPPDSAFDGMLHQAQIYLRGLMGQQGSVPVSVERLEEKARETLRPEAWDYVAGGAGAEHTVQANREAFRRWRIVPRMLRDVSRRDLSVELVGQRLPAPILLGPVGVQGILHADAELASARAAASLGVPFVYSTAASRSMEQVAEVMGAAPRWYQLYWARDPEIAASMLSRAEGAGYSAVVVTLDTTILGWRQRDLERAYLPFLRSEGVGCFFSDPVFRSRLAAPPEQDPLSAVRLWTTLFANPALTWDDLPFLRRHTRLPILLKGILHADDAARAVACGMDGVIVSNHGGRQVDGAIGALDALPGVVDAVKGRIPVLFDSGVRHGADAFKALALGARAVLLGRLYVYGLAVAGEQGVREVVQNFLADFDLTMALSGYRSVGELDPTALVRNTV